MKTFFQLKVEILHAIHVAGGRRPGDRAYLYIGGEEYATLRRGDGQDSILPWNSKPDGDQTFYGLMVVPVYKKNYLHVVVERS